MKKRQTTVVLLFIILSLNCSDSTNETSKINGETVSIPKTTSDHIEIVLNWCVSAKPIIGPAPVCCVNFPNMDEKTLVSAVHLARNHCADLYPLLAAVIVRMHREQKKRFPITCPIDTKQDVCRLFISAYVCLIEIKDEILLEDLYDFILSMYAKKMLFSDLLAKEIGNMESNE